jgi:[Skp1-protein]-hydroxyproline N-acetylglucosaminyltransferase
MAPRDEQQTRSRKKPISNGSTVSSIGNGIYVSDNGSRSSAREERLARRKSRVKKARSRSKKEGTPLCLAATGVFCVYLFLCAVLFKSMPEEQRQVGISKVRDVVQKTKERVRKTKEKVTSKFSSFRHHDVADEVHSDESATAAAAAEVKISLLPGIPLGKWPVSIRNEEFNFEEIEHPGHLDGSVKMHVPKFWADDPVAIHQNKQMTRERAMAIGTCIVADDKGSFMRGDKCPEDQRTIFVAIASYRDFQCRDTVDSIFSRASYPERVRVAVVDQIAGDDVSCDRPHEPCETNPKQSLCRWKDQIDVFQMDAALAVGPVFARHLGHRLYRGEYYSMQSDAHVTFTRNWDVDIIQQMEATKDDMAVLSTYLTDLQGSIDENGNSKRNTRPIMCNTEYEGVGEEKHLRHLSQPEAMPEIKGMPQAQPYWAAGFSFSRGHFVATVPYDLYQPMIFQGEEMSITLRGFTIGYDFFAPERSVCFHSYEKFAPERNKVHKFWEHSNMYAGTGKKAMKRLLGIVHMNPEVDPSEWDHREVRYFVLYIFHYTILSD